MIRAISIPGGGLWILAAALVTPVAGQGPPASPVRYTEALSHPTRQRVQLPGTVESPTVSLVASEVDGLVTQLVAREGSRVRKGDIVARLSKSNLELRRKGADGQIKEVEARLKRAQSVLSRAKELYADSLIAPDDFEQAYTEVMALEGRLDQLRATLERIELDLERCDIRAPLAGVIITEETEVGQWISVGEAVVEILSQDNLEVRVDLPEVYFHQLHVGDSTQIRFEALPGVDLTGTVKSVIPRADPRARTFPAKISIPNEGSMIGVGQLAQVYLPVGRASEAVIVPKDAIVTKGPARFVYAINDDGSTRQIEVEIGESMGSWNVVSGDLAEGDKIITRGNERIYPGMTVEGTPLEYPLP